LSDEYIQQIYIHVYQCKSKVIHTSPKTQDYIVLVQFARDNISLSSILTNTPHIEWKHFVVQTGI